MMNSDKIPPELVSALPEKANTAVAVNQDIVLTLSKSIRVGKGNITVSNGGSDIRVIPVNSLEITVEDNKLKLNLVNDLLPNNHYSVKIDSTAIEDLNGNRDAGINNTKMLYFYTIDTLAPRLIKSSPLANASSVAVNSNIVLTLSEKIQTGTGNITLISGSDSRTISIADPQVKISGTTLTINPTVDFNIGSTYKVHFDAGAIKDLAPVNNLSAAIDLSFATKATGDKQAPILQNYAGKGLVSDNLQLTFQENIKIGKGSFTLVNSTDSTDKMLIDVTSPQVSIVNNVLTINPINNLKPESTYLLTAPKGIVTDVAKNAFAGITAKVPFTFDIYDNVAPTLTITDDKTSVTNSAILYTFTLSEPSTNFGIDDIAVTGGKPAAVGPTVYTLLSAVSPTVYTLSVTPDANSTTPVTINVAAGKFTDIVGNPNLATVQSEQDVDTVAPTIKIEDNQPNVATGGAVIYTFTLSEPSSNFSIDDITINGGTKAATLKDESSTTVYTFLKEVTTNVYTLSVTPNNNSITPITVDVAAGKFTDAAGNLNIAAVQSIQQVKTTPTLGKAIDGYLAGATVTVGTYTTTTDASGNFTLPSSVKGEVVVSGGTDLTTGKAFKGVLKAPEGASTVTPLTTVQQGFIASGQTPAEAQASVAKAFGFANNVDLTKYDPIDALKNASPAEKAQATALIANAAKIANFLVIASETLKGAGGDKVTAASAGDAVLKSLVNSVSSAGSTGVIDLGNAALLITVLTNSAKEVAKTVAGTTDNFAAKITAMSVTVASVIKDATDNIAAVVVAGGSSDTLLTSMGNVSKFTQEGASAQLQTIAKTLDPANATAILASAVSALTGDAADKSISKGSSTPDPVTPPTPDPVTPSPPDPITPPTPPAPSPPPVFQNTLSALNKDTGGFVVANNAVGSAKLIATNEGLSIFDLVALKSNKSFVGTVTALNIFDTAGALATNAALTGSVISAVSNVIVNETGTNTPATLSQLAAIDVVNGNSALTYTKVSGLVSDFFTTGTTPAELSALSDNYISSGKSVVVTDAVSIAQIIALDSKNGSGTVTY
ncbi:MAG: hypothetical protein RLZZ384_916, partial [Pseudomonadota bacterium]